MQDTSTHYRAANDIFLSPKGYHRNKDGTHFAGQADISYLPTKEQLTVANLIIELSRNIVEQQYGQRPNWKFATEASPNAILVWGRSKFEIKVAANSTRYEAYDFDPSTIQQQVLSNLLKRKQNKEVSELDQVINQLRRANATSALSSVSIGDVTANCNLPRVTNSLQVAATHNFSSFEDTALAPRKMNDNGRTGG